MQHYKYADFVGAVARRIRALRIERGYSQRSFAKEHDWIHSHWALIENGKKMSLETLVKAANSFNLTVEQLLSETARQDGPGVGSAGFKSKKIAAKSSDC